MTQTVNQWCHELMLIGEKSKFLKKFAFYYHCFFPLKSQSNQQKLVVSSGNATQNVNWIITRILELNNIQTAALNLI